MIDKKKVLGVIPARGASKRLPRKNILPLSGKPLIYWSIKSALECDYIDRLIVSTEDPEIASISELYGAEIPFLRPDTLATDEVTTIEVITHLLNKLRKKEEYYDYIVLLQPTSPLRNSNHIKSALEKIIERKANAIVSVCEAEHHPFWCNTLPEDKSMDNFLRKDLHNLRSQDLPTYYRLNGAIYICRSNTLLLENTFLPSKGCSAFIMSQKSSIDIDTQEDFMLAQLTFDSKNE